MRTIGALAVGIVSAAILFSSATLAAPGDVDTSFNAETGVSGWVYMVKPAPDGKLLIGGGFTTVQGATRTGIARLNADGSLDNTFNPPPLATPFIVTAAIQTDGKVIVGGSTSATARILRLNPDGSIDTSFSPPSIPGQQISKVILQPDAKIIVGGSFQKNGGAPGDIITRLNADGSVDTNFNVTAFAGYYNPPAIALAQDGKIIVGAGGDPIRFNADGSIDSSFSAATFSAVGVDSLAVEPDGKTLAAGRFQRADGSVMNLIRLNADGSLDMNFAPLQRNDDYSLPAIELANDGTIFVAAFSTSRSEILRLNDDGAVKGDYLIPSGATSAMQTMAVDELQNIILGGGFVWPHGIANIARLRADGSVDRSFQPGFSLTGVSVPKITVDSGNKVVTALYAYPIGAAIQRFNIDGSVDTSFQMATLSGNPTVLTVQTDGRILAASEYPNAGSLAAAFTRLNPDGTPDASFKFQGASKPINVAVQQPDGKILIAGEFITLYGLAADRVARLNPDGSIDHSFQSLLFLGSLAVEYDFVRALAVQPDGKILVGLELHSCGCTGTKRTAVLRLNADGSYDPTFDSSGIVPMYANTIFPEPDGKILVGGFQFLEMPTGKTMRNGVVRLNSDGSLDTAFSTPLPMGADVRTMFFDQTGKLVINRGVVMRLSANGALDGAFNTATPAGGDLYTSDLALAPDGNLYLSDSFNAINGVARPRLVRLFGSPVPIPLKVSATSDALTLDWSNASMHLQSAPSVEGPYTDVPNAHAPWKPSPSTTNAFFRLRSD